MRHTLAAALLVCTGMASAQVLEVSLARELDLDGLRGLGPTTTRQLLAERKRAPFRDWADLMQRVPGVGARKAAQLSAQGLRVNGQSYPSVTPAPAEPHQQP